MGMNSRAIITIAIILSFAAGFMSAEIISVRSGNGLNVTEVVSNTNTTVMIINDRDYYPVAMKMIDDAHKSIHMVMYEIKWYGDPDNDYHDVSKLGKSLVSAEKRGCDVKIIMDDGRGYGFENPDMVEWAENWKKYFEAHGIQVKFDWSNQTTHDKLIIIDGEIVIVGSTNWSTSALDYNHEANALIENEKVAEEYEEYFEHLWDMYS